MTSIYKLTSPKITGCIELHYTAGLLTCISIAIKQPLNDRQFNWLLSSITQKEADVMNLQGSGLTVSAAMPSNHKIALFCRLYELYEKIKYRVSPADSGKIKLITIDEPMLTAYFKSDNFLFKKKRSISNLVKYYNELLQEIAAGPASKHPDYWSSKHAAKIEGTPEYKDYISHLHKIGLKPQYDRQGHVKDWIKQ